jgi:hypothetical protein
VRRGSGLRSGLGNGKASHYGYENEKSSHKTSEDGRNVAPASLPHSNRIPAVIRSSCWVLSMWRREEISHAAPCRGIAAIFKSNR